MLRTALLVVALLIPGLTHASKAPAKAVTPAAPNLCSDYEKQFPPCDLPNADKKKAKNLYEQAIKLAQKKRYSEALEKLKAARALSHLDMVYEREEKAFREMAVSDDLRAGSEALQKGDANAALAAFRNAVELDPTNQYAQQRLHDALPEPEEFGRRKLRAEMGETRLKPEAGVRSIEFRGNSTQLLEQFARQFGISTVTDQGLMPRNVRVKLDDVNWETGSQILARICKVLIIPLSERQVLLANDTEENRRELTQMSLRTFYAVGGTTTQELTELTTSLRILFDLRFISQNPAQGSIVIRAPQATLDAIANFLDYLQDDRPSVMLDVKVFNISTTLTKELGISAPDQFSVFNVYTEVRNLVSSSSFQEIAAALAASGQTVNATTVLAALLASSTSTSGLSSSVLTQPFVTFGGGITLTGITLPATALRFSRNESQVRSMGQALLRAGHGKAATMKVGQRYPIVSEIFSAATANSSLLSALGMSTGITASIPSPQFSYEDLGLVLKATPQVHGKLISLDYELTVRSLGTTTVNGLPIINSREIKGTISTDSGESVVIAGFINRGELASISGIPGLAMIPGLGRAFSYESPQNNLTELLVVMTPHLSSGRTTAGSYIRVPTNVPK
ncbi:MAG: hypothetical protein CXZ00_02690 [Acidobacteria bacterium]|nr:MAG: hypothetical protein CXZ00_02690 [Acidobacteriota bacterium]